MPAVFEHPHRVRPEEIDGLGHANNLAYLQWIVTAAVEHSIAQGWGPDEYRRLGGGWVVRRHAIKYLKSALLDDEIVVRTWLDELRRFSCRRRYLVERVADRAILATAETEWAFIELATGNLTKVPHEVAGAFVLMAAGNVPGDELRP
jgi:acyl-CoA thioester hydrolase